MIGLVLAAAGEGSRFGGTPKQFTLIGEIPVYLRALQPFLDLVEETIILVPSEWLSQVRAEVERRELDDIKVAVGDRRRQDTVSSGLDLLTSNIEIVLVHDAARPFVTPKLIQRVIEGTKQFAACIPVLPVADTIKEVEKGIVRRTLDRRRLYMAQTPQGFYFSRLKDGFNQARKEGWEVTDESSLLERIGEPVHAVEGDRGNIKITWREDLANFQFLNDRT